ncbi:taurine catabolism dioxygenase [Cryphonectria parasitica EP155]|uniref:Taurine catabolism dioxygenase n=1 Tax=Cryphonectria parasitica (strain ATCC 38755 / EP155) TaxID=660469 RepID=A0A9P4XX00_CRYP1|nr:taurine catabolism dioxygenase [Cryphonectria parasitica EP155]KAF3762834.1 taurine catabolism dioxygenase [Cryphonectria parasitica EP155]
MAPSALTTIDTSPEEVLPALTPSVVGKPVKGLPQAKAGSLDQFKSFEVTPNIGREYEDVNLAEWLRAPNSDQLIRDLAITVSQRGVVFFRAQNEMTVELQKDLAQKLGVASGKPPTSKLHIFPFVHKEKQLDDKEITVITHEDKPVDKDKARARLQDPNVTPIYHMWHSDTTFEHVPADYAVLRMVEIPSTGGDTVWASGYEVFDRLSKPMQSFLSSLTFTGGQPKYHENAAKNGIPYYTDPRGAPENVGKHIRAIHPVVRTNPVTGWNSVYCLGHHVEKINGVTPVESRKLLEWIHEMVVLNHDIHVRHRWTHPNDMAIWDNRSMVHTATPDYLGKGLGDRRGFRAMSIGERPYFDPEASGRAEALERD